MSRCYRQVSWSEPSLQDPASSAPVGQRLGGSAIVALVAEASGKPSSQAIASASQFVEGLSDRRVVVRRAALRLLAWLGHEAAGVAAEHVAERLRVDEDAAVRCWAARALANMGRQAAAQHEKVAAAAAGDHDGAVRCLAIAALACMGRRFLQAAASHAYVASDLLLAQVDTVDDPEVRRAAALALLQLGPHGGQSSAERLGLALRDSDVEVRRLAAAALERFQELAAPQALDLAGALRDEDVTVRQWAARALEHMPCKAPPYMADVALAVSDSDPMVRRWALLILARLGREATRYVPEVTAALGDADLGVRCLAVAALGQFGECCGWLASDHAHVIVEGSQSKDDETRRVAALSSALVASQAVLGVSEASTVLKHDADVAVRRGAARTLERVAERIVQHSRLREQQSTGDTTGVCGFGWGLRRRQSKISQSQTVDDERQQHHHRHHHHHVHTHHHPHAHPEHQSRQSKLFGGARNEHQQTEHDDCGEEFDDDWHLNGNHCQHHYLGHHHHLHEPLLGCTIECNLDDGDDNVEDDVGMAAVAVSVAGELARSLDDEDATVRLLSVRGLGRLSDQAEAYAAAVDKLLSVEKHRAVRLVADWALSRLGKEGIALGEARKRREAAEARRVPVDVPTVASSTTPSRKWGCSYCSRLRRRFCGNGDSASSSDESESRKSLRSEASSMSRFSARSSIFAVALDPSLISSAGSRSSGARRCQAQIFAPALVSSGFSKRLRNRREGMEENIESEAVCMVYAFQIAAVFVMAFNTGSMSTDARVSSVFLKESCYGYLAISCTGFPLWFSSVRSFYNATLSRRALLHMIRTVCRCGLSPSLLSKGYHSASMVWAQNGLQNLYSIPVLVVTCLALCADPNNSASAIVEVQKNRQVMTCCLFVSCAVCGKNLVMGDLAYIHWTGPRAYLMAYHFLLRLSEIALRVLTCGFFAFLFSLVTTRHEVLFLALLAVEWFSWYVAVLPGKEADRHAKASAITASLVLVFVNPFYFGSTIPAIQFQHANRVYFRVRALQGLVAVTLVGVVHTRGYALFHLALPLSLVMTGNIFVVVVVYQHMRHQRTVYGVKMKISKQRDMSSAWLISALNFIFSRPKDQRKEDEEEEEEEEDEMHSPRDDHDPAESGSVSKSRSSSSSSSSSTSSCTDSEVEEQLEQERLHEVIRMRGLTGSRDSNSSPENQEVTRWSSIRSSVLHVFQR